MLNSKSPIPLYHQLADIISSRIRSGEYQPGERIPSENRLAAVYKIGRPTVRQAIDLLVGKHLLIKKRGSGTYVLKRKKEIGLFSLAGTTSAFLEKGIRVQTKILERMQFVPVANDGNNPFSGESAYFLSRLRSVDGLPVLIEDIYLDSDLFPGIDRIDFEGRSLARIAKDSYYMEPIGGRQNFRILSLEGKNAVFLGISGKKPVLRVDRYLHFPQSENAVFAVLHCRTDRFVFSQQIGGNFT